MNKATREAAAPKLEGKTALVTGATSGIGLECAVMLAGAEANVIVVGRNSDKLETAHAEIKQHADPKKITTLRCDFSSQADIRRLTDDILAHHTHLDILVNNVGGVHSKRTLTEDDIEATFAVNHLGYFLLANLLLERLIESAPARIVNVASHLHYKGTLDFNDLGFEHGYTILRAYARSKLANVLFTRELAKRLENTGVTVNAVHPGTVSSHIWDGAPRWTQPFFTLIKKWLLGRICG
jgi:NAD(P)-dependent dehydrogenase (short-subunit alcohol dehydrogenase family)